MSASTARRQVEVDKILKADVMSKVGCIPPWLSSDNHCDGIYEFSNQSALYKQLIGNSDFVHDYVAPMLFFEENVAEMAVKKPCLQV